MHQLHILKKLLLFIIFLVSINTISAQSPIPDLKAFEYRITYKNHATGLMVIEKDWTSCNLIVASSLHEKEIALTNADGVVRDFYTILKRNDAISDFDKGIIAFDCTDSKQKSCIVTYMPGIGEKVFYILAIAFPGKANTAFISYNLKQ